MCMRYSEPYAYKYDNKDTSKDLNEAYKFLSNGQEDSSKKVSFETILVLHNI